MGQAINAVTGTRLWLLSFLFLDDFALSFVFDLRGCCNCNSVVVVQRLIHFSAHPQVMQQHRQLSCRGHDGPLLAVASSSFRQLESPAPEIAVDAEWPQDVLRSLHQQRAQVRVAFLADVQLWLALSRVPPSWLQSQIAAHVTTLTEAMRILEGQQERQRDQRAYPFTCFSTATCG